jgi:hypothetical protein
MVKLKLTHLELIAVAVSIFLMLGNRVDVAVYCLLLALIAGNNRFRDDGDEEKL